MIIPMKKTSFYFSIYILLVGVVWLSACSDFLDEEAKGSQVDKNYYKKDIILIS